MKQMNFLIVDDEPLSRSYLRDLITEFCSGDHQVYEAANAAKARNVLDNFPIDTVFLDIEMPGENGFECLNTWQGERAFQLVFVSGYDHYALKAIKEEPVDYLLKPVDKKEFALTMQKVEQRAAHSTSTFSDKSYLEQKLALYYQGGFRLVTLQEVVYLQAADNYTYVMLTSGERILLSKPLVTFERKLDPHWFFRVHKSHIINLHHFQEYLAEDGGYVKLDNGEKLHISRYRLQQFFDSVQMLTGGLKA